MKNWTLAVMAAARAQLGQTVEQASSWGSRLATWLLVGNAAALALAIQVLRETSGEQAQLAFLSGRLFGAGLVLAFGGATVSYFTLIWTLWLQSRSVAVLDKFTHLAAVEEWRRELGKPLTDAEMNAQTEEMASHTQELEALAAKMRRGPLRLSIVAMSVLALSAAAFVSGVTIPLAKLRPMTAAGGDRLAVEENARPGEPERTSAP